MPTVEASGQQLADGTEQTLATIAANRSLLLRVDVSVLADGETVVLRVKERVLVGGADRTIFADIFDNGNGTRSQMPVSIPISSPHQAVFTLQQDTTFGAFKTFDWSVESL